MTSVYLRRLWTVPLIGQVVRTGLHSFCKGIETIPFKRDGVFRVAPFVDFVFKKLVDGVDGFVVAKSELAVDAPKLDRGLCPGFSTKVSIMSCAAVASPESMAARTMEAAAVDIPKR